MPGNSLLLPTDYYFVDEEENNEKIAATDDENYIRINGNDFSYSINKKTGSFVSLKYKGTEYLEGGPEFIVWRAPIANDIDPWGSNSFGRSNFTPGMGRSIDNQLRTLGMRDLISEVDGTMSCFR